MNPKIFDQRTSVLITLLVCYFLGCETVCANHLDGCVPPSSCDDGRCGNCREDHPGTTGCSCSGCECVVCALDSWCCNIAWDEVCAGLAEAYCVCDHLPTVSPAPSTSVSPSSRPSISQQPSQASTCQGPTACSDGSCGNCLESLPLPGCSCTGCQCVVCEMDSFCCRVAWDSLCAGLAIKECDCTIPVPSISPAPSTSFEPSLSPTRTANPSISARPSTSRQPSIFLCQGENNSTNTTVQCWDGSCGNCDQSRFAPGCDCSSCECVVCGIDSFCCENYWDAACVNLARDLCPCKPITTASPSPFSLPPSTQPPALLICNNVSDICADESCGDCKETRFYPGCSCLSCQCAVCALDSYCCGNSWDSLCVEQAEELCECGTSSPTVSPAPSFSLAPSVRPSYSAMPSVSVVPSAGLCDSFEPSVETECKDGACGNCFEILPGTGCSCTSCMCTICNLDSFCCTTMWDSICASAAQQFCDCGSAQPSSSPAPSVSSVPSDIPTLTPSPTLPQCDFWEAVETPCNDESCGNCRQSRPAEVGCNCSSCQCIVCTYNPSCCSTAWDSFCVLDAEFFCDCFDPPSPTISPAPSISHVPSLPPTPSVSIPPSFLLCNEQNSPVESCSGVTCGNCKESRSEPGCSCSSCECLICSLDSWCCDIDWDSVCVAQAKDLCDCSIPSFPSISPAPSMSLAPTNRPSTSSWPTSGPCPEETTCSNDGGLSLTCGNCLEPRLSETGCSCEGCECLVCELFPPCCSFGWDFYCTQLASWYCDCPPSPYDQPSSVPSFSLGPSQLPSVSAMPTSDCGKCNEVNFATTASGCSDPLCESSVCAVDTYCCTYEWDSTCVTRAQELCGCPAANKLSNAERLFGFSGRPEFFAIPGSVAEIDIWACGGRGAFNGNSHPESGYSYNHGGAAFALSVPVTPGEILTINVGGRGTYTAGGYNGGGSPGTADCVLATGGGGGGATVVTQMVNGTATRVVVAGGGGGNGGNSLAGCGPGGGGGGGAGYFGGGGGGGNGGLGGGGGNWTAIGLGGLGGGREENTTLSLEYSGQDGFPPSLGGMGGSGGSAPADQASLNTSHWGPPGGPGFVFGFPGNSSVADKWTGGGGGGGSSIVTTTQDVLYGRCNAMVLDGNVKIQYEIPSLSVQKNTFDDNNNRRHSRRGKERPRPKIIQFEGGDWVCADSSVVRCEPMEPGNPKCGQWCIRIN